MSYFIDLKPGDSITLPKHQSFSSESKHLFTEKMIMSVQAALAAERPLLIRGEPGVGKSQLARAVAEHLKWLFLPFVINSNTSLDDLFWYYDAVGRLSDAQMAQKEKK